MHGIGVKWGEVPESHPNGETLNYTVSYHSETPEGLMQKTLIDAPTRFANLENLANNTNYSITVLASNQYGNGPASVPIFVTTSNGSKFFFCAE